MTIVLRLYMAKEPQTLILGLLIDPFRVAGLSVRLFHKLFGYRDLRLADFQTFGRHDFRGSAGCTVGVREEWRQGCRLILA